MGPDLIIRPAEMRDSTAYTDHVIAHMAESGKNGAPVFAPGHRPNRDEVRESAEARWAKRLQDPTWGRSWVLEAPDRRIVGHIDLRGGRVSTEMHRAALGMGIEQAFTRKGHGRRLIDVAVAWALSETPIAWIDLGVFTNNEPAIKLYERCGFVREMVRKDAFRLEDGTSIDDMFMTLKIR
jgi:RimJ/RimL family protein N-acetyltransferase